MPTVTHPSLTSVATNAAPAAIEPYSQAIKAGDLVFVSGTEHSKTEAHQFKTYIVTAKGYDDLTEIVGEWPGEKDFAVIVSAIEARGPRPLVIDDLPPDLDTAELTRREAVEEERATISTPLERPNPEPPTSCAPLGPSNPTRMPLPAVITKSDAITPSPTPKLKPVSSFMLSDRL